MVNTTVEEFNTQQKQAQIEGLAHEVWSASQLAPGEGIADGVERIVRVLRAALDAEEQPK